MRTFLPCVTVTAQPRGEHGRWLRVVCDWCARVAVCVGVFVFVCLRVTCERRCQVRKQSRPHRRGVGTVSGCRTGGHRRHATTGSQHRPHAAEEDGMGGGYWPRCTWQAGCRGSDRSSWQRRARWVGLKHACSHGTGCGCTHAAENAPVVMAVLPRLVFVGGPCDVGVQLEETSASVSRRQS